MEMKKAAGGNEKELQMEMEKGCGMAMQTGAWVKGRREDQAGFGRGPERV